MRLKIDYSKEVGVERASSIVQEKKKLATINVKGCWLYNGSSNTDGYAQVFVKPNSLLHAKGRSAQKAFLLHVISYLAANRELPAGHHVSHLCGSRSCFNPEHLVAESALKNNARKGCPGSLSCHGCHNIYSLHLPAYSNLHWDELYTVPLAHVFTLLS